MPTTKSTHLQASSPASPAAQQQSTPQQSQESATVVPSALSAEDNFINDEELVTVGVPVRSLQQDGNHNSSNNNSSIPSGSTQQTQQQASALLDVRVPKTVDVLKVLRDSHAVRNILESNEYFNTKEEQEIFFQEKIWNIFATKLYNAIKQCVPKSIRKVKSATKKYVTAKEEVIDWVAKYPLLPINESEKKRDEAMLVIHFLGFEFSKTFHKLITPIGKEKRVPICEQITHVLQDTARLELKDYFGAGISKHVYYMIGWLCKAGQEDANRRTKTNDIGSCMKSLMNNSTDGAAANSEYKNKLPDGVTELVDRRCRFGGLKYPNLQLYTVFAKVERVYTLLSTPTNFMIFGEETLNLICSGIIENTEMMDDFKQLFSCDSFDDDTIAATVSFYMKAFANMRLRDLCFRYNSNLNEGPEVGVRQSLVGVKSSAKSTSKKKKRKKKAERLEDDESIAMDEHEEEEQAVLQDKQEELEHEEMRIAAEEEIAEDQLKECTIHQQAPNHMEE